MSSLDPANFDMTIIGDDDSDHAIDVTAASQLSDETFDIAFSDDGHPIVPNILVDWKAWVTAERERDVNLPGRGHNLRNYWTRGPGAIKIKWGVEGDFYRCVSHLGKYVRDPKGLCNEYHQRATGFPPGKGPHVGADGETEALCSSDEVEAYDLNEEWTKDAPVSTVTASDETNITVADDSKMPYGDVEYADPGYQEDKIKRYPLDTEAHIRAAWSYINMPKNAEKYSRQDLRKVRARIAKAMRKLGVKVQAALLEDIVAAAVAGVPVDNVDMDEIYAPEVTEPAVAPVSSAAWRGVMTVEGVESGDGRMFAVDGLSWDTPPLPLMWQKETSHGGTNNVSVRVGSVDKIWREPAPDGSSKRVIMGEGTLDLGSADGREVFRRMRDGYMGGNSVDVDSVKDSQVEVKYPTPEPGTDGMTIDVFAKPELTTYKCGRIRATTMVEIPAFTEARLSLVGVPDNAVSLEDVESMTESAAGLIAATNVIEISDAPPREWFNEPTDVTPHGALTVTPHGRVYGYVAPAGVRHRSFPGREQYVPLGNVDYSRFMSGETIVADGGRVTVGRITMDCGHATTRRSLTAQQAGEHYDNACSVVATVRVGENEHGVWMAGALLSGLTAATVQRMMACSLSGDWRASLDVPGTREFVAALLVPVPGFPMARRAASVEMSDGLLVASCVPVMLETAESVAVPADDAGELDVELTPSTDAAAVAAACKRRVKTALLRSKVAGVRRN